MPSFTTSRSTAEFSPLQLTFAAIASLVLYALFVLMQTVRHRDYFLPAGDSVPKDAHATPPSIRMAWTAFGVLLVALIGVVLLAKGLSPIVERAVVDAGLPLAVVGIVIAALVLAPESLAAYRAARRDRLQTSLNLPAVAVVSLLLDLPLAMGIGPKGITLLVLSLFTITLSLGTGRTTILGGAVHLVIFAAYLFTTIVP